LLLLNNGPLTYNDIYEKTKIPEKELKKCLVALSMGKFKILEKSPQNKEEEYEIDQNDKFYHNKKFKVTLEKFKIGKLFQ
jgi:hypothetical protein